MDTYKGKPETMEKIAISPKNNLVHNEVRSSVFDPKPFEARHFKLNLKPSNPIRNPNQIKDFLKGIGGSQNQRTAKILESPLNKNISLSEEEWNKIVKNESRENLSHSILLNSLRMGIPKKLRPKIWPSSLTRRNT